MLNKKYWITKNGDKILISKMTNSHLINTVKMLERNAQHYVNNIPYPDFNGEMAQDCAERGYENLQNNPLMCLNNTVYDSFLDEILKRNLEKELF